jgi:hypothetical protein
MVNIEMGLQPFDGERGEGHSREERDTEERKGSEG